MELRPQRYVCTSHSSSASHFWSALVLASESQFSGLEHLELSCQLESSLNRSQDTKRIQKITYHTLQRHTLLTQHKHTDTRSLEVPTHSSQALRHCVRIGT